MGDCSLHGLCCRDVNSEHGLYKAMSLGDRLLDAHLSTPLASFVVFKNHSWRLFPHLETGDKMLNLLVKL